MPMNFLRRIAFFKARLRLARWRSRSVPRSREEYKITHFTPPDDPAIEFPHPENASLFTRLKENARPGVPGVMGGYRPSAHTDLISILYGLIPDPAVKKGYAFGRPVMATPTGLVFAYTGGTHYIFLKLRKERFYDARRDGGRFDPTYGQDWLEFR